jgi:FkbM family methyltransferase
VKSNEAAFAVRSAVKRTLARVGLDIRRVGSVHQLDAVGDMTWFLHHLRARGLVVEHALDVGASRGDWAELARDTFGCRVTMIEPLEEMGRYLQRIERCEWVHAAAGAEHSMLELAVGRRFVGSSFAGSGDRREVPVVPIGELGPAQLVKVDVQGFEMDVLAGAGALLGDAEMWVLETSLRRFSPGFPLLDEDVTFMAGHGYMVYDVAGYVRRPRDGDLAQLDLCFAKVGGVLDDSDSWS